MGIVLTRIDDRLIHGQILETWVPYLNVNCVLVGNDKIAGNSFRRKLIHASVPKNIEVLFAAIGELKELLSADEISRQRILLLFNSSEDALAAVRSGVSLSEINLGNLHGSPHAASLSCSVFLHQDDIENLVALEGSGIRISVQCVPSDRLKNWNDLIAGRTL